MTKDDAIKLIRSIHPDVTMLTKKQVAKLTNRSLSTLDRDIKNGTGIAYRKDRSKILYPIHEVAKWMTELIQTA